MRKTRLNKGRLLTDRIDEVGEAKKAGEENGVERESDMFEQRFRFFHGFFFLERFPDNQAKVKKDQRRKIEKRLKLVRVRKQEIADKKENDAEDDPECQSFGRVLAEG